MKGIIADNSRSFCQPTFYQIKPPSMMPCKNLLTPHLFLCTHKSLINLRCVASAGQWKLKYFWLENISLATEYFAFCLLLQEILIWLVVIYFLFHIFFLAANRLSIDTGTIHPLIAFWSCVTRNSQSEARIEAIWPIRGEQESEQRPCNYCKLRWRWKWEIVWGCQTAVGLTSINWWLRGGPWCNN